MKPLTPPDLPKHESFDFAAIDRDLGFTEPDKHPVLSEHDEERIAAASFMLGDILTFLSEPPSLRAVGGRAIGIALCLRPGLFDQKPAATVAAQFGVSKAVLNKYLTSVRQRFGLTSTYAKRAGTPAVYAGLRRGKSTHTGDGILHTLDAERAANAAHKERSRTAQDDLAHE